MALIDGSLFGLVPGINPQGQIDIDASMREFEADHYESSLYDFLRGGWRYIDPNPFVDGWHLQAIAEHLEAIVDGDITRLIINQPPRTSKSSMMVAFDPWVWAQPFSSDTSGPSVQFLHASYAQTLSIRDSVKTRRLIESPFYQRLWGNRFKITSDQNTKVRFDLDTGGYRLATSVGGTLTGEGGSIIIIDDPHNAVEMESDQTRQTTLSWFDNALSTRLNNPKTGAMILVMQRLHEDDLTGHILSSEDSRWVHLMLPMKYELDRAKIIYPNIIGWSDPRSMENELLAPNRYDAVSIEVLERQLGPYQTASQLQQRPSPKGGGIFKREWWQPWKEAHYPPCSYVIAALDTAYTTKEENDFSAMTVWGVFEDENENVKIILMYGWKAKLELHDLTLRVQETAKQYKLDTLLIENKAAGHSVRQELRRLSAYEDYTVILDDPKGQDKVARAYSVQHLFADGTIYAPDHLSWADTVITECEQFPKAAHDDLTDTVTMAIRYLRRTGSIVRGPERTADLAESNKHIGGSENTPLYPV